METWSISESWKFLGAGKRLAYCEGWFWTREGTKIGIVLNQECVVKVFWSLLYVSGPCSCRWILGEWAVLQLKNGVMPWLFGSELRILHILHDTVDVCEIRITSWKRFIMVYPMIYRVSTCFNHPKLVVYRISQNHCIWRVSRSLAQPPLGSSAATPSGSATYQWVLATSYIRIYFTLWLFNIAMGNGP